MLETGVGSKLGKNFTGMFSISAQYSITRLKADAKQYGPRLFGASAALGVSYNL